MFLMRIIVMVMTVMIHEISTWFYLCECDTSNGDPMKWQQFPIHGAHGTTRQMELLVSGSECSIFSMRSCKEILNTPNTQMMYTIYTTHIIYKTL